MEEYSGERKPVVVCSNGHTFCSRCANQIQVCAQCRETCLPQKIVNVALWQIVEPRAKALSEVPEIPPNQLTMLNSQPIAAGSYSDVFLYEWQGRKTIVKKLRLMPESNEMKEIKRETSLAISLLHTNIVQVYGTTRLEDGRFGIVMEFADKGDMRKENLDKLNKDQKVNVALNICSGIAYLHSKRVAHRDLKPENILLFGDEPTPKITDFGSSKVIQTMIQSTSMAGTIAYAAPELHDAGTVYGAPVDVYSFAMILYEMFSGLVAFKGYTLSQVVKAIIKNQRPTIPEDFPPKLAEIVQRGWDEDPAARPSLGQIEEVLLSMCTTRTKTPRAITRTPIVKVVSARQQTDEANNLILPASLISMTWPEGSDTNSTKQLRKEMTVGLEQMSNMKQMISGSVLKALAAVPRHLFLEPTRVEGSPDEKLRKAYTYNKAMGATTAPSNESSPEIIGAMLSLVKIETGANVLLVGGKGGYINSVVGQIVGINGKVVTASANSQILEICKARVNGNSPFMFSMQWIKVNSVQDVNTVQSAFEQFPKFHAIIYCGSTAPLPSGLASLLVSSGGSILAPVQLSSGKQQFQMFVRDADGATEVRKITEFGVIFEEAK